MAEFQAFGKTALDPNLLEPNCIRTLKYMLFTVAPAPGIEKLLTRFKLGLPEPSPLYQLFQWVTLSDLCYPAASC